MAHLAIAGGSPQRTSAFPGWPRVTDADRASLAEVTRSGDWSGGKIRERFEKRFAGYCGAKHCVTVANGTVSLELIDLVRIVQQRELLHSVNKHFSMSSHI